MRWLALLLLSFVPLASAQPPCVPGIYGTTLDVAAPKRYDLGWRLTWLCEMPTTLESVVVVCLHGTCSEQVFRDSYFNAIMSPDPTASIKAAWAKNVTTNCDTATGNVKTLCDQAYTDANALMAAFIARYPAPAPVVWKVAPNGTYTTRPTYAWANGVRSTTAAVERATVGADCNPAIGKDNYRGVLGRSDRVALCRQQ